jgi:long-subunit acyl-CoA synthetase (AMP-forming)
MSFSDYLDLSLNGNSFRFEQQNKSLKYKILSSSEFLLLKNNFSIVLKEKYAFKIHDTIISLIENSIEWTICDLALMKIGAIHAPLVPTTDIVKLGEIIDKVKPKAILVSNPLIYELFKPIEEKVTLINIDFSELEKMSNYISLKTYNTESLFFTSGTSGTMKAVRHPLDFVYKNTVKTVEYYNFAKGFRAMSLLPIQYAFERMYHYVFLALGMDICYASPYLGIVSNYLKYKPKISCIVPSLLEQLIDESHCSEEFKNYNEEMVPIFICSGAPIGISLRDKIKEAKITVWEMYGSTETLIVAANCHQIIETNSSFKIIEPQRTKIVDGLLMVKTEMLGYHEAFYKPDTFKDGFVNTLDRAEIIDECLFIKGRNSDLQKSKSGIFIDIVSIENRLKSYLNQNDLMVYLEESEICCFVSIDEEIIDKELKEKLINFIKCQKKEERIDMIAFTKPWSSKTGEYTESLKLKKSYIFEKNKHLLNKVTLL